MKLTKEEKQFCIGYASALQDMMRELTGDNTCGKSYDPMEIDDTTIYSYAFDMKDGGRHHPINDYMNADDICFTILDETVSWIKGFWEEIK